MICRNILVIFLMFVAANGGFCADVLSGGKLKIDTSFVRPDGAQMYCRTCSHKLTGKFSVSVLSLPVLSDESELDGVGPSYDWTITPVPKGKVSGWHDSEFQVVLSPGDIPTSFDVSVRATWSCTRSDGTAGTVSTTATIRFDAIEYSYAVRPEEEIDSRGDGDLVDSHPGIAAVDVKCCRDISSLNLELTAKPASPKWQNERNSVAMPWTRTGGILRWRTASPYWYAKSGNPPDCCASNPAVYEFALSVDGCDGHRQNVTVYLPEDDKESAVAPVRLGKAEVVEILRETLNAGDKEVVKATFQLSQFEVLYEMRTMASSQYKAKIREEELYHKNQCERKIGYGFEDAFNITNVVSAMGGEGDEFCVITDDNAEIARAKEICREYIDQEFDNSIKYYRVNHDYREWAAKKSVGFREAYKYHCAYERFGFARAPVEKIQKEELR